MKLGAKGKAVVVAAAATLALSACTAQTGIVEDTTVTVGWNQAFYSFNEDTTSGNATANANILYLTQAYFNYYNSDLELVPNEQFGKVELISEDPLTVKYTVNEGITWSDGVAVDATDLLFHWAALSGNFNEGEPEYSEEDGLLIPGDNVWFDSVAAGGGIEQVTQTPEIGSDGRSITMIFDEQLVDWQLLFSSAGKPAHIVGTRALDIEDPTEAKEAVKKAILENDREVLRPLSEFWSLGFDAVEMPADTGITVGNGAYVVTDFVKDQYITLKARENYKAGPAPSVETITVRFIPDALSAVMALQNNEVDIIEPQATTDVLEAAAQISFAKVHEQGGSTYEHIDLTMDNGGPFDPASYGGDAEKAKKVRQAFLKAIDVQEIIDKLIVPLQEDAKPMNSQLFFPGAPGYDEASGNNGHGDYGTGDIEGAKALLDEVGVSTPIEVCVLYGEGNTRREAQFALFADMVKDVGFQLVDCAAAGWGGLLGSGTYDASLFAWQSTSTGVTASDPTFKTGGGNNFNGYSNAEGDSLWNQLKTEFDAKKQREILVDIDKLIYDDAYGLPLFQHPQITIYHQDLEGIKPSPLSPTLFWNFWEWKAPADKN